MSKFRIILIVLFIGLLNSCVSSSIILTGTTREEIDPDKVKLYINAPSQYEVIGIIEVSSDVGFSRQLAQDRAMDKLKYRAAIVGANGVLLSHTGSQVIESAGYYSNGIYHGGGSSSKILAQGYAIYVIEE